MASPSATPHTVTLRVFPGPLPPLLSASPDFQTSVEMDPTFCWRCMLWISHFNPIWTISGISCDTCYLEKIPLVSILVMDMYLNTVLHVISRNLEGEWETGVCAQLTLLIQSWQRDCGNTVSNPLLHPCT